MMGSQTEPALSQKEITVLTDYFRSSEEIGVETHPSKANYTLEKTFFK